MKSQSPIVYRYRLGRAETIRRSEFVVSRYLCADNLLNAMPACGRTACRMLRRQEAATQSQPGLDSLIVGLPAPDWLAKLVAPDADHERFSCTTGIHRLQPGEGTRLKLSASLGSAFRALVFDLS